MGKLRDIAEKIVSTWMYPSLFALLSFVGWVTKMPWPFALVESALCFLPLLAPVGRAYMAPLLLVLPIISEDVSFQSIPPYMYVLLASYLVSIGLYIWMNKCPFKASKPSLAFLMLFFVFLISVIANIIQTGTYEPSAMFFVIGMILLLVVSLLNCSIMENHKDSFHYLAVCISILSVLISLEVYSYYIWNPNDIFENNFFLGWSNAKAMVGTILVITLPFYGVLIYRKRWESVTCIFALISTFMLATKSGLLALVLGFIPLVLLSFRSFGRSYQYISLGLCCLFVGTFALLLGYAENFRQPFIESIQSLNLMASADAPLYSYGIDGFKSNPILGPSAQGLVGNVGGIETSQGMIMPLRDTVITTLYMGGILGLVSLGICKIAVYYSAIKRKSKDKWLFLFFLLITDFIGITDNTLFNLFFLTIYLLALAAFENASLYDKVKVKDRYYEMTSQY